MPGGRVRPTAFPAHSPDAAIDACSTATVAFTHTIARRSRNRSPASAEARTRFSSRRSLLRVGSLGGRSENVALEVRSVRRIRVAGGSVRSDEARQWASAGHSVEEALQLKEIGLQPRDVMPSSHCRLADRGVANEFALLWTHLELEERTATVWLDEGWDLLCALTWVLAGVDGAAAKDWLAEGLDALSAKSLSSEMRPTRLVVGVDQRSTPQHGDPGGTTGSIRMGRRSGPRRASTLQGRRSGTPSRSDRPRPQPSLGWGCCQRQLVVGETWAYRR